MTKAKNTSWVTWSAVALIVVLSFFVGEHLLSKYLHTPEDPETIRQRVQRRTEEFERQRKVDALTPMEIGDGMVKAFDRCGSPWDTARSIDAAGQQDVFQYKRSKEYPDDCEGTFFFWNYNLVRIVR